MSVMQKYVPQDITSLVIDALAEDLLEPQDDNNRDCRFALAKCLLVSRSFCHHSRRHLFHSLRLQDIPRTTFFDRVARLREILAPQSNPQLGMISYVKILSVKIFNRQGTLYTKNDAGLAIILEEFLHFGSCLEEFRFWGSAIEWHKLGAAIQKLFCAVIRTSSLSTINLSGLNGVPHSVLVGVTCKRLRLWRITMDSCVDDEASSLELSNIPQLQLEDFETDGMTPLQYVSSNGPRVNLHDVTTSPFSHLKKLALDVESEQEYKAALIILSEAKLTLKTLQISMYSGATAFAAVSPFDFSQFKNLQSLELRCRAPSSYLMISDLQDILDKFSVIIRILNTPSPCLSLRQLNLVFLSDLLDYSSHSIQLHEASIWREIDVLLSKPEFSSLDRVGIVFKMDMNSSIPSPEERANFLGTAVPQFRMAFPSLSVSDSVDFTVDIRHRHD